MFQQSSAVTSHASILAAQIQSRADVFLAGGTLIACLALMFLYNWQTTRKSKGGYRRFINWTSAQRAEARQYQAERRRMPPSPVAVETSRQAKIWRKAAWALGVVSIGFAACSGATSTPSMEWTAIAISGVFMGVCIIFYVTEIYLEYKALKQQREYDELQSS
ncbi:hypothetical protein [Jatrophihabitans sp.]|uniref:hypothetical protein n=1 Tax=Jatrophihabitans sp. TaxID=1932789 RepID=UPI002F0449CC